LGIRRKWKTTFQPNRPSLAQRGPTRERPRRLTGGLHLPAAVSRPCALFPPLFSGAGLSAPVALACVPSFSLCLAGPTRQHTEPFPPRVCFPSLRRGASLSVLPSPRTVVDQRARMPRTPATSTAHAPQLPYEHRPHPLSLPCLISRKLTLSRALPSPLALAGDPRPSCLPSSPPEAVPSHPELRPEVRNPVSCSIFLIRTWSSPI
jgi:hypothetical protein